MPKESKIQNSFNHIRPTHAGRTANTDATHTHTHAHAQSSIVGVLNIWQEWIQC